MNVVRCPGLGPDRLSTYLAALGLAKAVSQADPNLVIGWDGTVFVLETAVDDVAQFLLRDYRPTPIVSPWNGGSGFQPQDRKQKQFVDAIAATDTARLADFRGAVTAARSVVAMGDLEKGRLVQELRNRCPDTAVDWLDAAVVLGLDISSPAFPPLAGTGGNDGRLEFSSNFHQRLHDVLPDLGAEEKKSRAWALDMLEGTSKQPQVKAAVGMFDPVAAGGPNSAALGAADARINPWIFVLMLEGVTLFASGAARRLGQRGRAAMPFTVNAGPGGRMPDAGGEGSRGEFWAPVFRRASLRQVRQIIREARASWDGGTATSAVQMYGAARSFGVDREITAFARFAFAQLNGLAFSAVLRDVVRVHADPGAEIMIQPLQRVRFLRHDSAAGERAQRLALAASTDFLRDPDVDALVAALSAVTRQELAAARSTRSVADLAARRAPRLVPASLLFSWLRLREDVGPELRLAASICSARGRTAALRGRSNGQDFWTLRSVLLPSDPGGRLHGEQVAVRGLGIRPVTDVLADVVVWAAQHHGDDGGRVGRGFVPLFGHRARPQPEDAHALAGGLLDEERLEDAVLAMLQVDWSRVPEPVHLDGRSASAVPHPALALLQLFTSQQLVIAGQPATPDARRHGLDVTWPVRIRAGQLTGVTAEAAAVARRSSQIVSSASGVSLQPMRVVTPLVQLPHDGGRDQRLLAALLAAASTTFARTAIRAESSTIPTIPAVSTQPPVLVEGAES